MTQGDFRNSTKIDNTTFTRNTLKADPSQNGSPIPFQNGYSEYEKTTGTQSSLDVVLFYVMGFCAL